MERDGPRRLLSTLREVREYADPPITRAVLRDVLEVARWTGSSKNSQRWELVVIEEREGLRRLAEVTAGGAHVAGAALAIVQVTTSHENVDDLGRQAERIMLAAHAYGIGASLMTVNAGNDQRAIRDVLGLPPRRVVPAVIALGYPVRTRDETAPADAAAKKRIGFLRGLRTVRRYAARPIQEEVKKDILAAGEVVPAGGAGGATLVAVEDRETLTGLAALAPNGGHLEDAALAIIRLGMPAEEAEKLGRTHRALLAGRMTERLMLAAWAHGVGSCAISVFPAENQRRARELLGTPPERWINVTAMGYPADDRAHLFSADPSVLLRPVPTGRKPVSQFVSWERYGRTEADA